MFFALVRWGRPALSLVNCPNCRSALEECNVAGVAFQHCRACEGTLVARSAVRALRSVDAGLHPALHEPQTAPTGNEPKIHDCPKCGKPMLSYMFGGGHTRAESCDACALVFFERGELAAVLEEARSGIKLDETARTRLHGHQVLWTWDRFARADTAVIVAALIGLAGFVQMTRRGRTDIFLAAAISLLLYAVYRWRAERARTAAAEQLNRLVASEAANSAAAQAPAGPWAPSAGPVAPKAKPRLCAFCRAALPPNSSHCGVCDSDFG